MYSANFCPSDLQWWLIGSEAMATKQGLRGHLGLSAEQDQIFLKSAYIDLDLGRRRSGLG